MDTLPLPDVGSTITQIAGLSPAAQVTALVVLGAVAVTWVWSRRPQQGPDATTVVKALELTAQAQAETAASMAVIAKQVEAVAEDVRRVAEDLRTLAGVVVSRPKAAV